MNCRESETQIFAERDGALDDSQRAALASHVAECAACRRLRDGFAVTIESWRVSTQQVAVPDAELEWQKLRREIRGGAGSKSAAAAATRRAPIAWFAAPLAAAAAIALMLVLNRTTPDATGESVAKAATENAPAVVFVDEKSGWTFVEEAHRG